MIKLENLTKKYNTKKKEIVVLKDINIVFPNKGLIGIIGRSGSGKTTLLNILLGLVQPTTGKYSIDDKNSSDFTLMQWDNLRKYEMGLIFQNSHLFERLTLIENIELSLKINGIEHKDEIRINNLLIKFDLMDQKDTYIKDLSGGERQRLSIVNALLKGVKVLLADEPTGSLDEENTMSVFEELEKLSSEILVIVVTHDTDTFKKYSDQMIKLSYGKIIENTIYNEPSVQLKEEQVKKKVTWKDRFQIEHDVFKKQAFRKLFSYMFLCLFSFIALIFVSILTFNAHKFEFDMLRHGKISDSYLSNSKDNIVYKHSIKNMDTSQYKNVVFKPTFIDEFDISLQDIDMSVASVNSNLIFRTIILENIEDFNIIITDYQADIFKEKGILAFDSYDEMISKTLNFNGLTLKIKQIISTNYKTEQDQSNLKMRTKLDVLRVNPKTLSEMIYTKYMKQVASTEYGNVHVSSNKYLYKFESHNYVGDKDLQKNDIAISEILLSVLIGDDYDFSKTQSYLGREIELRLNNQKVTATIKMIIVEEGLTAYLNEDRFKEVFAIQNIDLKSFDHTYAISFANEKALKEIVRDLKKYQLEIVNDVSIEIYAAQNFMSVLKKMMPFVLAIFAPLMLLVIFFLSKLLINQNKKEIGLLFSNGFSFKDTLYIYLMHMGKIVMISYVISFSVYKLFESIVNHNYFETTFVPMFTINIFYLVAVLIIFIALSFLWIYLELNKKSKNEVLELLKND